MNYFSFILKNQLRSENWWKFDVLFKTLEKMKSIIWFSEIRIRTAYFHWIEVTGKYARHSREKYICSRWMILYEFVEWCYRNKIKSESLFLHFSESGSESLLKLLSKLFLDLIAIYWWKCIYIWSSKHELKSNEKLQNFFLKKLDTKIYHKIQSNRWFHSAHKCDKLSNSTKCNKQVLFVGHNSFRSIASYRNEFTNHFHWFRLPFHSK